MKFVELTCPHCQNIHRCSIGSTVTEISCPVCNNQIDLSSINSEEFWTDKVKCLKQKDSSKEIVEVARRKIPYPGAFREIAIAIRKDIRALRKEKADTKNLLNELYQWAVIENFFSAIKWGKIINGSILHSTAIACVKDIKTPYNKIGYKNLTLLNKTDVKWLVEAFGEPVSHLSAVKGNPGLLKQAKEAFRLAEQKDEQLYWESAGFDSPPDTDKCSTTSETKPRKTRNRHPTQQSGCLTSVLLGVSVIFLLFIFL